MRAQVTTPGRPYRYVTSGLPHVLLSGITLWTCTDCGKTMTEIPRLGELHRVIAAALVAKPTLLTGREVLFLRKHSGFPAGEFAALLGVDRTHLSRVENGRLESFGETSDRLVRAVTSIAAGNVATRDALLALSGRLRKAKARRQLFALSANHWKQAV